MHHVDLVPEAGPKGQQQGQAAEGTTDHWAEADSSIGETQAVTEVAVTAEVPHKTATTGDHQDAVDAAQHPTDTSTPTESTTKQTQKPKSALKWTTTNNNAFQDHHLLKVQSLQDHNLPFQDHSPIQNPIENNSFQDHFSVKDVWDIMSLKKHSPSHLTLQAICLECILSALTPLSPQYNMLEEKSP